jgi:hypothetical protein
LKSLKDSVVKGLKVSQKEQNKSIERKEYKVDLESEKSKSEGSKYQYSEEKKESRISNEIDIFNEANLPFDTPKSNNQEESVNEPKQLVINLLFNFNLG